MRHFFSRRIRIRITIAGFSLKVKEFNPIVECETRSSEVTNLKLSPKILCHPRPMRRQPNADRGSGYECSKAAQDLDPVRVKLAPQVTNGMTIVSIYLWI